MSNIRITKKHAKLAADHQQFMMQEEEQKIKLLRKQLQEAEDSRMKGDCMRSASKYGMSSTEKIEFILYMIFCSSIATLITLVLIFMK